MRAPLRRGVAQFLVALPLVLSACSTTPEPDLAVIAVLSADGDAALASDPAHAVFVEQIESRCPHCVVLERDAGGDLREQRDQLDAVLAEGADVVLVDPVSADGGESLVLAAAPTPVVATGTFVPGAALHVGFDLAGAGSSLASTVPEQSRVVVVAAPRIDVDAGQVNERLDAGLANRGVDVVDRMQPLSTEDPEIGRWLRRVLTRDEPLDAVVVADEGGVVARVLAELPPERRPDLIAAGTDLDSVARLIEGDQAASVHLPTRALGEAAARSALSLAFDEQVDGTSLLEGVPSLVLEPEPVTLATLTDTVVRDRTYTLDDLCVGALQRRCVELGLR